MTATERKRLLQARDGVEQARERYLATLRDLRRRYSLADLAAVLGVSRQAVHKLLR